jgi:predicted membrane protein
MRLKMDDETKINMMIAIVFMVPFILLFVQHWITYTVAFLYFYMMVWYAIENREELIKLKDKLRDKK